MDFTTFNISASALVAQKARMDVISANLANVNTTRTDKGGPYRRQEVVFKAASVGGFEEQMGRSMGVEVVDIVEDRSPPKIVYDPAHPDADEKGNVAMPNINLMKEMVDMTMTTRSYEANTTAISAAKSMYLKALEIGR